MNILFVGAHHDDLELGCGGSVKRWTEEGHRVWGATLTDSSWVQPDGRRRRADGRAKKDADAAARILGYDPLHLCYVPAFELDYSDDKVVDLLRIIDENRIDTLVGIWPEDAHRDHRAAGEIALAASRRVARVLLVRLSWNSPAPRFSPTYFVDVTKQFEARRAALRCYADEYDRTGRLWEKYILATATEWGLTAGCELAEGFEILKYRY